MSVQLNVYGTHDDVVGTLVLTVHDPAEDVAEVRFYVTDGTGQRSEPLPADRTGPGVYEKDVLLDPANETLIEPEVELDDESVLTPGARSFPRTSGREVTLVQAEHAERGGSVQIGAGLSLSRTTDGLRPLLRADQISLSLLDFREVERTTADVVFRWTRGAGVAEVFVYDLLRPVPILANPWPGAEVTPLVLLTENEYRAAIPPLGSVRYLQFEPRAADGTAGAVQRVKVESLPEARPAIEYIGQAPADGINKTDVVCIVSDPLNRAGVLHAWLNRDAAWEADPQDAPDGSITLSEPRAVTAVDQWALRGGGSAALFHEVTLHAGYGKRIWLEFVTQDGASSGQKDYLLRTWASIVDEATNELIDEAVKYRRQFVASLVPPEVVAALPALPDADYPPGSLVTLVAGDGSVKLYRNEDGAWTAAVPTTDLSGQIDEAQIADAAVTAAKIGAQAVTTAKLAVAAVTADVLAAGAVTETKITDSSISTPKLAAGAVTAGKIAAGSITSNEIAANTIVAGNIAAGTITGTEIAAGAITAGKIAAGTITGAKIAALAISADNLAAGAVTAGKIAANAVTAGTLQAGAINSSALFVSGVVDTNVLAANAVTAAKISVAELSDLTNEAGIIVRGLLRNGGNTNGIRLDNADSLPAWANYLDLDPSSGGVILKAGSVTIRANGTATFGDHFAIDSLGNGTFSGNLSAAGGTFAGSLSAASGTFAGDLRLDSADENFISFRHAGSEYGFIMTWISGSWKGISFSLSGAGYPFVVSTNGTSVVASFTADLRVSGDTDLSAGDLSVGDVYFTADWVARQGTTPDGDSFILDYAGVRKFHFSYQGKGVADTGWYTFSPRPDRPAEEMSAGDWIRWGAADALKPVKPYAGLPTEDHPFVMEEARALKRGRAEIAQREHDRYAKDISKIAIGTARWADKLWDALLQASDFDHFKQLLLEA